MTRTRRILMVAFVATALSADRVVASAPSASRPDMANAARRLAVRLLGVFRRSLAQARLAAFRRTGRLTRPRRFRLIDLAQRVYPVAFSPFQYRLPPPVL
jgi:hypothetical protein